MKDILKTLYTSGLAWHNKQLAENKKVEDTRYKCLYTTFGLHSVFKYLNESGGIYAYALDCEIQYEVIKTLLILNTSFEFKE